MYNLRYHLASLVSVFLALAIGVVLGGLIVDNSSAFDTDKIIKDLQAEYEQLRADNGTLVDQSEALEEMSALMMSANYSSALTGRSIAVLSTDTGASDQVVEALSGAGANAIAVRLAADKLSLDDADSELVLALDAAGVDVAGGGTEGVAQALVAEWTSTEASATPVTAALVSAGVLEIEGVDGVGTPVLGLSGLVNTAVTGEAIDPFALLVSKAFALTDMVSIGASPAGGAALVATASWDEGIGSIASVGSSLGNYSMVALFNGAEPGLYGLIDGATAAFATMPPSVGQ